MSEHVSVEVGAGGGPVAVKRAARRRRRGSGCATRPRCSKTVQGHPGVVELRGARRRRHHHVAVDGLARRRHLRGGELRAEEARGDGCARWPARSPTSTTEASCTGGITGDHVLLDGARASGARRLRRGLDAPVSPPAHAIGRRRARTSATSCSRSSRPSRRRAPQAPRRRGRPRGRRTAARGRRSRAPIPIRRGGPSAAALARLAAEIAGDGHRHPRGPIRLGRPEPSVHARPPARTRVRRSRRVVASTGCRAIRLRRRRRRDGRRRGRGRRGSRRRAAISHDRVGRPSSPPSSRQIDVRRGRAASTQRTRVADIGHCRSRSRGGERHDVDGDGATEAVHRSSRARSRSAIGATTSVKPTTTRSPSPTGTATVERHRRCCATRDRRGLRVRRVGRRRRAGDGAAVATASRAPSRWPAASAVRRHHGRRRHRHDVDARGRRAG